MASGFELTGKTDLRFTETLFRVRDTVYYAQSLETLTLKTVEASISSHTC